MQKELLPEDNRTLVGEDTIFKDSLTDVYNRRYFFESGQLLYANALRKHLSIAVAMLAPDGFGRISDAYGRTAVLQHVARLLQKRFRQTDLVARFGSEAFCILVSNMKTDTIPGIFEAVRAMMTDTSIDIDSQVIRVTVSIGVCSQLKTSLEAMLDAADTRLDLAKQQGGNRVICS